MNNNVGPNNGQVDQSGVQPNINNTTVPVNSVSNPINSDVLQTVNNNNPVPVNTGVSQTTNDNFVTSSQLQGQYAQNSVQINPQGATSNGNSVDNLNMQPMKEVVIGANPPSKGKYAILIIFFIALLLMVWFLPEISSYIETLKAEKQQSNEIITTGLLKCELERSSDNYDLSYQQNFSFEDSKLTKLSYIEETRGDMNQDAAELDTMNLECENLSTIAKGLDGISVSCELSGGTMTEKQVFDFSSLDPESVTAAFTEAGAIYPNYKNGQSIDTIERNMKASGYSCERIK